LLGIRSIWRPRQCQSRRCAGSPYRIKCLGCFGNPRLSCRGTKSSDPSPSQGRVQCELDMGASSGARRRGSPRPCRDRNRHQNPHAQSRSVRTPDGRSQGDQSRSVGSLDGKSRGGARSSRWPVGVSVGFGRCDQAACQTPIQSPTPPFATYARRPAFFGLSPIILAAQRD
jgi:hypothetical protein